MLLRTDRLLLVPMTLRMVEAVLLGRRDEAERIAEARLPDAWPGRALIERAFTASLDEIRVDPERRLWGDRLLVTRPDGDARERRVVGSVVFHGQPADDGVAEIAYGIEEGSQGLGFATEATRACVGWALGEPGVSTVAATTFPWHHASLRVIQKLGMTRIGRREHELFGEMHVYGVRKDAFARTETREGEFSTLRG